MIHFDVQESFQPHVDESRLQLVILSVLDFEKLQDEIELTVVISDDEQIQELNREYLGSDCPTDVLSFPSEETDPETGLQYLGDIIVSYPRAVEQAQISGHPTSAEIELLLVHAVLHLLGYDHAEPEEKNNMWAAQRTILSLLGTPLQVFPE
jgi:probable rRNA maturation factor